MTDKVNGNAGKHDFVKSFVPKMCATFSVGVFEWLPTKDGKHLKKSKARVRVSGPTSDPEAVYSVARVVAAQLDAGKYAGPKTVSVD